MHHQRTSYRAGFTLIEMLVACVILAIGLIGLSQLYLASMWTYQKSRNLALATEVAQYELEKAQSYGYTGLNGALTDDLYLRTQSGGIYTWLPAGNGVSFPVSQLPGGQGTVVWTHYVASSQTVASLLQVEVTITWGGSVRAQSKMKVDTLIAKR